MKRKRERGATRPVSAGLLLYKKEVDSETSISTIRYLLGMVPQRNNWTVFKGMPSNSEEQLEATALREFEEETGTSNIVKRIQSEAVLRGATSKKDLVIFLQEGSEVKEGMTMRYNAENHVTNYSYFGNWSR